MKVVQQIIAFGYFVIAAVIVGIICIYMQEWNQIERLTYKTKQVNWLRDNVHQAYAQMLELTLFGEAILEWDEGDMAVYHRKRMMIDSLLCDFKNYYSGERLDSVRMLLAEKEIQLFSIARLFDEQSALHEEIAKRASHSIRKYPRAEEKKRLLGHAQKERYFTADHYQQIIFTAS